MNVTMTRNDKELIVELDGRLDTITSPGVEEQLEPALEGVERLVFDLAKLNYISSAGLRVLTGAAITMEEQGKMIVKNVQPMVMQIFDITSMKNVFEIEQP